MSSNEIGNGHLWEQLSYVSLSKFFPLTTLCSECNLPSCCDISHKSFNTESINDLTDPIGSTTTPNSSETIRAVVHTPNEYHQRTDNQQYVKQIPLMNRNNHHILLTLIYILTQVNIIFKLILNLTTEEFI